MTYKDAIYLVSDTQEDFIDACQAEGLCDENGDVIMITHNYSMIERHPFTEFTGETVEIDGVSYQEKKTVDGYHVMLIAIDDIGIEHLAVDEVSE